MDPKDIERLSERLHRARLEKREEQRLTAEVPELGLADAYSIQADGIRRRCSEGERVVGYKMGLTSEAKRKQMNLDSPVYGVLTDRMQVEPDGTLPLATGIHPKIEPEIAFRLGRDLKGPLTMEAAAAACSGVAPAMEILDSRYVGFKYFSLPDVVADNSSSFMFVVGKFVPLAGFQLDALPMTMSINGEAKQRATSDAISGHPLRSLMQLCELLAPRQVTVPAGSIVLAGAATVAEQLRAGDRVELSVDGLGSVAVSAK